MNRKQLIALCVCNLGVTLMGTMVLTLLPVYAVELGIDQGLTGIYIGVAFGTMALGSLAGGWLSNRFQRRTLTLLVASVVALPATVLMGQSGNLAVLIICTLIVFFAGGLTVALVAILTGLFADPDQRGRTFGIVTMMLGVGQAIGGIATGFIADRWGFQGLYQAAALVWLVPFVAALFMQDKIIERPLAGQPKPVSVPLPSAFWLLMSAAILVSITNNGVMLARTFLMDDLEFDATAISSLLSITGLISIPLPFVIGWLSDRLGRRQLLILCYVLASAGTLVLLAEPSLPQFWLSAALLSFIGSSMSVGNALVIDVTAPEAMSTALARYASASFISGIVGYGVTGLIIQRLGLQVSLLLGAILLLVGILMVSRVRHQVQVAHA
jgi:MFS family permease